MASKKEKQRRNRMAKGRMKVRDLTKEDNSIGGMKDVTRKGGAKRSRTGEQNRSLSRF